MTSYRPVNALLRGLDVLRALNSMKGKATVGKLHQATTLDKATIVRMLETLEHEGYVFRDRHTRLYHVTGKALMLSSGYKRQRVVGVQVQPILEEFRDQVGWPSDVAILEDDAMMLLETSREAGPMQLNRSAGYRAPILGTSLGLAYLAYADRSEQKKVLKMQAKQPGLWNEIAHDLTLAEKTFEDIRTMGYAVMHPAYSHLEYQGKISSLGVPIGKAGAVKGAINVLYLKATLSSTEAQEKLLIPLQKAANKMVDFL